MLEITTKEKKRNEQGFRIKNAETPLTKSIIGVIISYNQKRKEV